jgi:hypothetical protein
MPSIQVGSDVTKAGSAQTWGKGASHKRVEQGKQEDDSYVSKWGVWQG